MNQTETTSATTTVQEPWAGIITDITKPIDTEPMEQPAIEEIYVHNKLNVQAVFIKTITYRGTPAKLFYAQERLTITNLFNSILDSMDVAQFVTQGYE